MSELSIQSFYQKAKLLLSPEVFSFIDSGSLDELALKRNRKSFNDFLLFCQESFAD